jgi:hypothetical protein
MGALLMISITLIAGAAAFGFVNGQVGVSASAYGNKAAGNINFLNEREALTFVNFPSPTPLTDTQVTVWIENIGNIALGGYTLTITGPYCTGLGDGCSPKAGSLTITCVQGGNCAIALTSGSCLGMTNPLVSIPTKALLAFTFTIPALCLTTFQLTPNSPPNAPTASYTVQFTGQYGSTASYIKNR